MTTPLLTPPLNAAEEALALRWRLLSDAPHWEAPTPRADDPSLPWRVRGLRLPLPDVRPGWQLFVDDLREIHYLTQWAPGRAHEGAVSAGPWVLARDRWEAQGLIARLGLPARISFDHDYGDPAITGDGSALAQWLFERHLDGLIDLAPMAWQVHSSNPSGAENIRQTLRGAARVASGNP